MGEPARKIGQETNLFASVMIAQAILESGSGGSQLSQEPYNNLFGIKGEFEGQSGDPTDVGRRPDQETTFY
ncbi:glucosaminidase domain-containing protein [Enterococcus wangshanyuanii]|uniref:glucosaminidase domain-containing protein n=1 Tax=Enterococcus wangshanyuanii TaxID=2005703 RepID=UPI000B4B37D9|nr:glucosaminidase domain-containing protein [Enterococcus wangshanyuanii]